MDADTSRECTSVEDVLREIDAARSAHDQPIIVAISGFGGAGKSTLARRVVQSSPDTVRMRGDDFLDPTRSHRRSGDWDGVERSRLRREVLDPFRAGEAVLYRPFDWSTGSLGAPRALPRAETLVVDAIGIFHPELFDDFDLSIWVDVDLESATARGKARDIGLGRDHDALWDDVWVPNDRDFFTRFEPRTKADLLYAPADVD